MGVLRSLLGNTVQLQTMDKENTAGATEKKARDLDSYLLPDNVAQYRYSEVHEHSFDFRIGELPSTVTVFDSAGKPLDTESLDDDFSSTLLENADDSQYFHRVTPPVYSYLHCA